MELSENEYRILRQMLTEDPDADVVIARALALYNADNAGHTGLLHHVCHLYRDNGNASRILSDYYAHRDRWIEALPPMYRGIEAGLEPRIYYPMLLDMIVGAVREIGVAKARLQLLGLLNEEGLLTAADLLAFEPERPDPSAFAHALADADAAATAAPTGAPPTYGLLLCNYNDAGHLPRSLAAIAGQTRPFDEIVLVDDGSTDDSLAVIAAFADRLPQLKLHRLDRNVGVVQAYDIGLSRVTTDFVHLAAADDMIRPDFLEHLAAAGDRWPAAGAVFSHFLIQQRVMQITDESWRLNPGADFSDIAGFLRPSQIFALLENRLIWINGNSAIYRTAPFRAMTEAVPAHGYLADFLAGIRVMMNYGAAFVPRVLSEYGVDGDRFAFRSMNDPVRNRRASTSVIRSILSPSDLPGRALTRAFFQLRPNLFEHIPGFVTIFLPSTPGCAGLWLDHAEFYLSRGRPYKPRV